MFIGLGSAGRAFYRVASIGSILFVAFVSAAVAPGDPVPRPLDLLSLVFLTWFAFQGARAARFGGFFGADNVVVTGLFFERVIAWRDIAEVVVPEQIGALRVLASDGGFASSQLWADPMGALLDRSAARNAFAQLTARMNDKSIPVTRKTATYSRWGFGLHRRSAMVMKRTATLTRQDAMWFAGSVGIWLIGTQL